jgi:hypothetical protein
MRLMKFASNMYVPPAPVAIAFTAPAWIVPGLVKLEMNRARRVGRQEILAS